MKKPTKPPRKAKARKPKRRAVNQIVYGDDGCEMLAKKRERG